jgi:hypothetical protein
MGGIYEMKYATETGSGALIYVQKLGGGGELHGDLLSTLLFFQSKKIMLKMWKYQH